MARRFSLPDALPPLRGSAATVYAILWLLLLAIALWLAAGAAWYGLADGAGDAYSWHALGINRDPGNGALIDRIAGDELRRSRAPRGGEPGSRPSSEPLTPRDRDPAPNSGSDPAIRISSASPVGS